MTGSASTEGQKISQPLGRQAEMLAEKMGEVRREISKAIVGQSEVVEGVLTALLAGGPCPAGRRSRPRKDHAGAHARASRCSEIFEDSIHAGP